MRKLFKNKQQTLQKIYTYLILFCYLANDIQAQVNDTLTNVIVTTNVNMLPAQINVPTQVKSISTINNTQTIADVLKQFAGVQVKDYGGVGGLKTVSVRSLGANHTGILYDGAALGDAQGGQVDLGKYALDNVALIQLYNSNPTDILLPARAFSYASTIVIKSRGYTLDNQLDKNLQVKLQQGSFQNFSTSLAYSKIIKQKFSNQFYAWYQTAKNNYPFLDYENTGAIQTRTNSTITAYRAEYDAQYKKNDSNVIHLKAFYYSSKRGLPGSIILYNPTTNQTLTDNNFFVQSNWCYSPTKNNSLRIVAKYSYDYYFYINPFYPNSSGKLENKFYQSEQYVSASFKQKICNPITASISTDYFFSQLKRTDAYAVNFANPSRHSFLQNVAIKLKKKKYEVQSNLLYTQITEQVENTTAANNFKAFTPALSAIWKPMPLQPIQLRFFYKNIFRAPTFNDLYYTNIGNNNLKPEYAQQFNLGITYEAKNTKVNSANFCTIDGYLNKVSNKILAVPKQNLFVWSMQNVGKVYVKGIDATVHKILYKKNKIKLNSNFAYSYQKAIDKSVKNSNLYNTQLPYTPIHTGSAAITAFINSCTITYSILASSYRYRQGEAIAENKLPGWVTNDISIAYHTKNNCSIVAEANNVFNQTFEIIRYYPMPRFNYKITLQKKFKKNT